MCRNRAPSAALTHASPQTGRPATTARHSRQESDSEARTCRHGATLALCARNNSPDRDRRTLGCVADQKRREVAGQWSKHKSGVRGGRFWDARKWANPIVRDGAHQAGSGRLLCRQRDHTLRGDAEVEAIVRLPPAGRSGPPRHAWSWRDTDRPLRMPRGRAGYADPRRLRRRVPTGPRAGGQRRRRLGIGRRQGGARRARGRSIKGEAARVSRARAESDWIQRGSAHAPTATQTRSWQQSLRADLPGPSAPPSPSSRRSFSGASSTPRKPHGQGSS
jgi:hypothetical protein